MSLTKYDRYKNSGIDWLETIPEHWEVKRLKDLGNLQNGLSKGGDYFGFGFPFVSYGNVYNDTIVSERVVSLANSSKDEQKHYSVLKGDVFFTRTSETVNEIGIASTCLIAIPKATFSGFTIRFRPISNTLFPSYSKYLFKTHYKNLFLTSRMNIVTRASLSQGLLNQLPVVIPPFQEQQQIANYLDQQTKTIDKKISLLEAKIEHYQALKKSLINETVCRGLDKTVALKDSGIEWIGAIPEHWEVARLKDNISLFHGYSYSKEDLSDNTKNYLIKITQLKNQKIDISNAHELKEQSNKYRIYKNDLLIALSGATSGKVAIHNIEEKCYLNQRVAKIVSKEYDYKYLFYFFQLDRFVSQMFIISISTAQPNFTNKILEVNNLYLSIQEQQQIAKYLDEKTDIIDQIITNIQSQVERLKELRQSLINEVVTGKVRVPEMEHVK